MSTVFEKLNTAQREAACAGDAPLLILAGAGTGKTNTLAHRVAHLILRGVAPERMLLLTFTRRAALEMTRRAQRIVAEAVKNERAIRLPWSGTFHAIANKLIRRHTGRLELIAQRGECLAQAVSPGLQLTVGPERINQQLAWV